MARKSDEYSFTASHKDEDIVFQSPINADEYTDEELEKMLAENDLLREKLRNKDATKEDRRRMVELTTKFRKPEIPVPSTPKMADRIKNIEMLTRKHEIKAMREMICQAENVDLAFVCDCTGSMDSHVEAVVNQIFEIVEEITISSPRLNLRLAFLGYRDVDDVKRFEILNFTEDCKQFKDFVAAVKCTGGFDAAEDIAGALEQVKLLNWTKPTRVLFHIADAPCHGREYSDVYDEYPDGDPNGLVMIDLVRAIKDLRIHYYFGKINDSTDKMISTLIAQLGAVYIQEIPMNKTDTLTKVISDSVTKTITQESLTLWRNKPKPMRSVAFNQIDEETLYEVDTTIPNFSALSPFKCIVYTHVDIVDNEALKHTVAVAKAVSVETLTNEEIQVKIAPHPFDQGAIRLAYYGQIIHKSCPADRIFKRFKSEYEKWPDKRLYFRQIENTAVACYLANEYNKIKKPHCLPIEFLKSHVVEDSNNNKYYFMERPLQSDKYTKFCNNAGNWFPNNFDESLVRFSLWTMEFTEGYVMVTDLQGVKETNRFILTDPAILCRDESRFGNTNMGPDFMLDCVIAGKMLLRSKGLLPD